MITIYGSSKSLLDQLTQLTVIGAEWLLCESPMEILHAIVHNGFASIFLAPLLIGTKWKCSSQKFIDSCFLSSFFFRFKQETRFLKKKNFFNWLRETGNRF